MRMQLEGSFHNCTDAGYPLAAPGRAAGIADISGELVMDNSAAEAKHKPTARQGQYLQIQDTPYVYHDPGTWFRQKF